MAKFRELVEHLEFEELQKINNDINTGAAHMKRIVGNRLKQKETEHGMICNVCMNNLDPLSVNNFTIIFGPSDFKKKASFCGIDCMKYFIAHLEGMKKEAQQAQDERH